MNVTTEAQADAERRARKCDCGECQVTRPFAIARGVPRTGEIRTRLEAQRGAREGAANACAGKVERP